MKKIAAIPQCEEDLSKVLGEATRNLTDADVEAIAKKIHANGCVIYTPEHAENLVAFASHVSKEGAEALARFGDLIASEQRFYHKIFFRAAIVMLILSLLGNKLTSAIFGKSLIDLIYK